MRLAYVFGSNGPAGDQLRFAERDAHRMADALGAHRCGFTVRHPANGAEVAEVRQQLFELSQQCAPDDTFICYFSGHGRLLRGSLFLLWNSTDLDNPLLTALHVADIIRALEYCRARNKLLILDCCHAGAAAGMPKGAIDVAALNLPTENFLVLMASGRLEETREFDSLGGSFLSVSIADALTDRFREADLDSDGLLSIEELLKWLEYRATEHNASVPNGRVPVPYLFGRKQGTFILNRSAEEWTPHEIHLPDDTSLVVLPVAPLPPLMRRFHSRDTDQLFAVAMGKHPVTNKQYRAFTSATGHSPPEGETFAPQDESSAKSWMPWNWPKNARRRLASQPDSFDEEPMVGAGWVRPFHPWQQDAFKGEEHPVVCVSAINDSMAYCDWFRERAQSALGYPIYIDLPPTAMWTFAALKTEAPQWNSPIVKDMIAVAHHKQLAPSPIDKDGRRLSRTGVSDMFGNVWEWNSPYDWGFRDPESGHRRFLDPLLIRGGGYMDDLAKIKLQMTEYELSHGSRTARSDIGFRIAAKVPFRTLPASVQDQLRLCPGVHYQEDVFRGGGSEGGDLI